MAEQLTFTTMGGDLVSITRRGKGKRKPTPQRGYVMPPGTGPEGEKCKTCQHIVRSRKFRKCGLNRARWTHGPGSDILANAPACSKWEPRS